MEDTDLEQLRLCILFFLQKDHALLTDIYFDLNAAISNIS